jgi:hypothetical protein
MAIELADITPGWYWVADRDLYFDLSIVFVMLWDSDNQTLVVLHHGVETPDGFPETLERYEFLVRIEKPDVRTLLSEEALEFMDSAPDADSLSFEIVDRTPEVPRDGHRRRSH